MTYGIKIKSTDVYFIGLCLLAASMPLSKAGMSIAQMLLVGNWLIEWRISWKFQSFFRNRTALILCSLYVLHCIGLIYTVDFDYALKDLKVKLPMLILPLIIATSEPLNHKKFRIFIIVLSLGLLASSLHAFYNYITHDYQNIRDICVFVSHLRISLMICISVFFLLKFILSDKEIGKNLKIAFVILILWFVYFLIILESFTGPLLIIVCTFVLILIYLSRIKKIIVRVALVSVIILIPVIIFIYVLHMYNKYFTYTVKEDTVLELFTPGGHAYTHNTLDNDVENGNYVSRYICHEEMQKEWNNRSKINYDSTDLRGNNIKYTLIRFLASKGLRKDSAGVANLGSDEVKAIEEGIADVNLMNMHSLQARIYETLWEFKNYNETDDPNGHSLVMRLEYWRAAFEIIRKHPLFGVGTGDMNIAFAQQYDEMKSKLSMRWRLKAHNQFLSLGVGFGIPGILWFSFILFYPLFVRKHRTDFYYIIFFIILFCSLLTEDTIESQAGLTFYAFFNALLLLGRKEITEKPG
ncbi:MAG: O-antigen ligase family protein [Bacteroidota bacterium]